MIVLSLDGQLNWLSHGIIVPLSLICRESHLQIACNKHGAKNVVETLAKLAEKVWSADIDRFLIAFELSFRTSEGGKSKFSWKRQSFNLFTVTPAEAVLYQVLKVPLRIVGLRSKWFICNARTVEGFTKQGSPATRSDAHHLWLQLWWVFHASERVKDHLNEGKRGFIYLPLFGSPLNRKWRSGHRWLVGAKRRKTRLLGCGQSRQAG